MFGYIRPLKGELKVKDYDRFKAVYCGLCHSMRRMCGFTARFTVNFDFTFMAMLLSEIKTPCYRYKRCVSSPFRKKCCVYDDPALDAAAAFSVILAYWKLRDSAGDEHGGKAVAAWISCLLLAAPYKKARSFAPEFDRKVRENLEELSRLETGGCPSIDRVADKFAAILEEAAAGVSDEGRRRVLSQIFYHTGRIVYILDAIDDLDEDLKKGLYNPLPLRFGLVNNALADNDKKALEITLRHSQNLLISALELLDNGPCTDILSNIVYMGIPWVTKQVMSGRRKNRNAKKRLMPVDGYNWNDERNGQTDE